MTAEPKVLVAGDRMYAAAREFLAAVEGFRENPDFQDTWAEMLLRTLIASPWWQDLRHASKDYARARGL